NLRQETPRLAYFPILQAGPGPNFVQIRAQFSGGRSAAALIADCPAAVRRGNPHVRLVAFEPISAAVHRTLAPAPLVSWVSAGFGIVALLLTSVGLYGILAYTVARRTSEFGIRVALGARPLTILRMVMTEGLMHVGIGLIAGIFAASSLSHLVTKLLFAVEPYDRVTFAGAAMILTLVAAAASYGPAGRATEGEPAVARKHE